MKYIEEFSEINQYENKIVLHSYNENSLEVEDEIMNIQKENDSIEVKIHSLTEKELIADMFITKNLRVKTVIKMLQKKGWEII